MLQRLVDGGNTVIVIEHHLDVVKNADWVVDLGPYGGQRGGKVIAEGSPEQVAANEESATGRFLRDTLAVHDHVAKQAPKRRKQVAGAAASKNGASAGGPKAKARAKPKAKAKAGPKAGRATKATAKAEA